MKKLAQQLLKTVELVKEAEMLSPKSAFHFGDVSTMTAFQSLVMCPLLPLHRQAIQLSWLMKLASKKGKSFKDSMSVAVGFSSFNFEGTK